MDQNTLNVAIHNAFYRDLGVLSEKAPEYVDVNKDRLSNFKKAAALQGMTPEQALFGMLAKHLVSLSEMVGNPNDDRPKWEEKITDARNYLYLLEVLLIERFGWPVCPNLKE
jgi:hypothetical protein